MGNLLKINFTFLKLSLLNFFYLKYRTIFRKNQGGLSIRLHKRDKSSYIMISEVHSSDNKLLAEISCSDNISKYFSSKYFISEYDVNIENVDKSILSIPLLAAVITVAWATGADVYMESIDKDYLNSLKQIKSIFKNWFPQFDFSTKISVKNIIDNKFENDQYAMLFSSGVDSLSYYIQNKEKKPFLVSVWGADIPLNEPTFWNEVKNQLKNFANKEGVLIHFIKTNAKEMIDNELIGKEYSVIEGWWLTVSHGLILTSVTAPLQNFGTLLIASSFNNEYKLPHGSHFFNHNDFGWSNIKIVYDSSNLTRQEKIKYVLKENCEYNSYLRVCHEQFKDYNCGICEKCLRTIMGLILEGIDPRDCKFEIKEDVLDLIKNYLKNNLLDLDYTRILFLQDIQDNIPNKLNTKLYNSNEFFKWFKEFNLTDYEYNGNTKLSNFSRLYYLTKYKGINYTTKRMFSYLADRTKLQGN